MTEIEKKRIIITGAVSLLGNELCSILSPQYQITATVHTKTISPEDQKTGITYLPLNILDQKQITQLVSTVKPHIVIHLAALSDIDFCESNRDQAYLINVTGTSNICEALEGSETTLIFASSNAVFDGKNPPYDEKDTPNPVNYYGKTKFEAETIIESSRIAQSIVRFTTLFGWPPKDCRDNDLTRYLKKLKEFDPIQLVNDRYFNPISVITAAEAIKKIIEVGHREIFHIAGNERVNRFDFVKLIAEAFRLRNHPELLSIPSSSLPGIAPRPLDATLDNTKMGTYLGIIPKPLMDDLIFFRDHRPKYWEQL